MESLGGKNRLSPLFIDSSSTRRNSLSQGSGIRSQELQNGRIARVTLVRTPPFPLLKDKEFCGIFGRLTQKLSLAFFFGNF
jgi:hypothetical protein